MPDLYLQQTGTVILVIIKTGVIFPVCLLAGLHQNYQKDLDKNKPEDRTTVSYSLYRLLLGIDILQTAESMVKIKRKVTIVFLWKKYGINSMLYHFYHSIFIVFNFIYIVLFSMHCHYCIILFALYICIIVSIKNLNLDLVEVVPSVIS